VLVEEEPDKVKRRDQGKKKQEEATNAALAEEFDEIQARMDEYFERRKKLLAAERAEIIRNKPPIRAQVWNKMINYLKHMEDGSNTKKAGKRLKRIAYSTSKQKSPKKSKVIKEQEFAESNAEAAADYEQEKEELRS
ncbi:hypothetical protein Tco_1294215, partial [Tanacetum coccineum]